MTSDQNAKVRAEAATFLQEVRSLLLSTIDEEGTPEASYAPFVRADDNAFYVYVSELSSHTQNLRRGEKASVLLIEDEATASQIFARKRLTFRCDAALVERDSAHWISILDAFEAKFGDVMEMLRPLTDFQLFRLTPRSGRFVKGFAQAFRIEGPTLDDFKHINDVGHGSAPADR